LPPIKVKCYNYTKNTKKENIQSKYTRDADKFLAQPTYLSNVSSVQGTGCIPMGPDPENRVGDQDIGSPRRPVPSRL
jgi:hypothetical protein